MATIKVRPTTGAPTADVDLNPRELDQLIRMLQAELAVETYWPTVTTVSNPHGTITNARSGSILSARTGCQ